jgi:hypothetical protein
MDVDNIIRINLSLLRPRFTSLIITFWLWVISSQILSHGGCLKWTTKWKLLRLELFSVLIQGITTLLTKQIGVEDAILHVQVLLVVVLRFTILDSEMILFALTIVVEIVLFIIESEWIALVFDWSSRHESAFWKLQSFVSQLLLIVIIVSNAITKETLGSYYVIIWWGSVV